MENKAEDAFRKLAGERQCTTCGEWMTEFLPFTTINRLSHSYCSWACYDKHLPPVQVYYDGIR